MIEALSLVVGVFGIMLGIFFGVENRRLQRRLRRYTWNDMEAAVKSLAGRIEPEFKPDLILCSSAGSVGIVANLYLTYIDRFIPLYIGVSKKLEAAFASSPLFTGKYQTNRWETFLPTDLQATHAKRVLILEDVVISGETLKEMVKHLHGQGFVDDQIRIAALLVTELGFVHAPKIDYFWRALPDTQFELPWGRSLGKGT